MQIVSFMFRKIILFIVLMGGFTCISFSASTKKDSSLKTAIRTGNTVRAEKLINQGITSNDSSFTLLMESVANPTILKMLLDRDSSLINHQDPEGWTALIHASFAGKPESVELLLQYGANPNIVDTEARSALSWASGAGHIEVIEKLLANGADINSKDKQGYSALKWAILNKQNWAAEFLIKKGIDINLQDNHGRTAFMMDHIDDIILRKNLLKDINPHIQDENGWTLLHWAAVYSQSHLIDTLITHGANPNQQDHIGATPLMRAAGQGKHKTVEKLLKNGADIALKDNDENNALLWTVSLTDSPKTISTLLKYGASIDSKDINGHTALIWTIIKGFPNSLKLLLARGADPNIEANDGKTALLTAIEKNDINLVKILLQSGANTNPKAPKLNLFSLITEVSSHYIHGKIVNLNTFNKQEDSPLFAAIYKQNPEIVKLLLEYGANPLLNFSNDTIPPLMYAASFDSVDIIKLLLDFGADINHSGPMGETALMLASVYGKPKIVHFLLQAGADISIKDKTGATALVRASSLDGQKFLQELSTGKNSFSAEEALENQLKVLNLLIEAGAEINTTTLGDPVPLLTSISSPGQAKLTELLIKAGANINIKNQDGRTPLSIARENKDTETMDLLIKAGAKQ